MKKTVSPAMQAHAKIQRVLHYRFGSVCAYSALRSFVMETGRWFKKSGAFEGRETRGVWPSFLEVLFEAFTTKSDSIH